jgi:hypothetical protein
MQTSRRAWTVLLLVALAACSDKSQPQTSVPTHFLESCDESCPEPYACICGACTLTCHNDAPCSDEVKNAHCTVALSTDDAMECKGEKLVCDVACQRNSDCNPLGAGFTCEGSRCRAAPRPAEGTTSSGSTGETPAPRICDGSNDIRFGIWNDGGSFPPPGWLFMHPIADSFVFVDGSCRFYASSDALTGFAGGSLDEAEAEQLAIALHVARFDDWQVYNYQSCMDGGSSVISDGAHTFACMCGECGADAPEGLAEAMDAGQMWIKKLAGEGTLWTGAVSAVATDFLGTLHLEQPQTWPLTRPIDDIVVSNVKVTVDSGMIFDSADAAALRRLRKQQATVVPPSEDIYVTTDGVKKYSLFVRDELQHELTAPLADFKLAAWKVIEDASNEQAEKELAARDAGTP